MPEQPKNPMAKKVLKGCGGCAAAFLLLGVLGGIASTCTGGPKTQTVEPPKQVQAAEPQAAPDPFGKVLEEVRDGHHIESAAVSMIEGKAKLDLVISSDLVVSGNNYILVTAGYIEQALRKVRATGKLGDLWIVVVTLKAPFVDKFGNKSQGPAIRYTFKGEDLVRINWDNMDQQHLLEFADPEWLHIEGAMMAKEYAKTGNHAAWAPTFCRIAIFGK